MDIKNEVLYRVYGLLFVVLVPLALLLAWQTFRIAILEGPEWREVAEQQYIDERVIESERGDIYSLNGSLLATSVPYFDIFFDPYAAPAEAYYDPRNLDSLAYLLAHYVDDTYTTDGMRDQLLLWRDSTRSRDRYIPLKRQVTYSEKKRMEEWPIFNLGRNRGGFIAESRSERRRPFGALARRTIGYVRPGMAKVGLEGYYDDYLGGKPGKEIMYKVDPRRNLWLPSRNLTVIEPSQGNDVFTTIDINLQDITEQALMRAMREHLAEWGTAVVMDVETGAVRAIANLGRNETGDSYYELYNYAIAMATEPGSTFKLASIMALLEDEKVDLNDTIHINKGKWRFYEEEMVDATSSSLSMDSATVQRVFEISSNVGLARLIDKYYGKDAGDNAVQFIEKLHQFKLNQPTGIGLEGEAPPYIKTAYSEEDQWSGITLPWMATGYEIKMTPLQLLTFYNAVANGGRMMQPYLVREIRNDGQVVEEFVPTVISKRIAKPVTIERARLLLEGVVLRGTAKGLRSNRFDFAGKTGTAQLGYRRGTRGTRVEGYQASFAGYFPADQPRYSVIVVINKPTRGSYYGSDVAGPVFREIADKAFNSMVELHEPVNEGPRPILYAENLPSYDLGTAADIHTIMDYLDLPVYGVNEGIGVLVPRSDSLFLLARNLNEETVPDVLGLGLRDAVFVLENRGLQVKPNGVGRVRRQSLIPGTRIRGQTIQLYLN